MGIVFSSVIAIVAVLALIGSGIVSSYAASKSDTCKKAKDINIINAVVCFILAVILFLFLLI